MTLSSLLPSSRLAVGLAAFVLLIGLAACVPPPAIPPAALAPYPLGPGDHLRVIVFEQNQLGGEFTVDEDGDVSLPLVGRLRVAGLLPAQAEELITQRLGGGGLVKNPKVNIDVIHYRPVFVYGEVTRPGGYEPAGNLLVAGAVALAGGFTYRADISDMTIIHAYDPNHQRVPVGETSPVGPGDVIYVPERWF